MSQQQEKEKLNLRSKSPIIMSNRQKMALLNCNEKSSSNMHEFNENPKEIQETIVPCVKSTVVNPPKTYKHLNLNSNLQSTPITRNCNKSIKESRTIMNLSPIMSSVETNLNNCEYIFQHKLHNLDEINKLNPLSINDKQKLNTYEIVKKIPHVGNITDSHILSVNTRKQNEDNMGEKSKRCLFEKEKEIDMISNLDVDQDSLNISLDILEQVCQMSEIMDDSLVEEIKVNDTEKKKNKLAYFLYGNNTSKLDDKEEENELLQLALSMEDNLLSETKSKNKPHFKEEFTPLNQLKNKETHLSENDNKHYNNDKLKINKSDSKFNLFDHMGIDDIGNTQMCEIADITEPLESFDDHWTQQYLSNKFKFNNEKKENLLLHNSHHSNQSTCNNFLTITKNNLMTNSIMPKDLSTSQEQLTKVSDMALHKAQSLYKEELNDSSASIIDKTIANPNICKGFSTARGKSIKVSDVALHKVQSLFKEELNDSSASIKDETIIKSNICKGFSTAGGKSIKVSDVALHKAQSLFKEELNDSSTSIKDETIIKSNICKGFSTAGGKSIKVSDVALHKAQSLFKEEHNDSFTSIKDTTITNPNICKGFSTAGGKSIKISDVALHKAQSLFKEELNDSSASIKDKTITNPKMFNGFSTAGGKSIKVSDVALHKAQSLFKEELNDSSSSIKDKTITNPNICKGFSTAGGKSIKISDVALHKAQSLFKEESNDSSTSIKDETIIKSNICKGFSTAGGKSIKVSDVALHKAQSLFKEEHNDSSTSIKDTTITNPNICKGFLTAGGKSIKISDVALHKAQSLFKEELNDSSASIKDKTITNPNICEGFSTSGGKSLKVSDVALHSLSDENNEAQLINNSHKVMATSNCNDLNTTKPTNISESNTIFFEISKSEEECALEDLSLIDTVEKFEKEQMVHKPVLRNKRPGSPMYEINNKKKKCVNDEGWERYVLKTSFNEYLVKKLTKTKVPLPEAVNWVLPKICHTKQFPENNITSELFKLNVDNALNLKLCWERNLKLSDGCENKLYSFQDIKQFFLTHELVDEKLIPKGWIGNHFRLIAWKLAATEISFPDHFGKKLLTAKNMIHQLLFRYYTEIEKCKRSSLKKILEKDESATKRIILCVSRIVKENTAGTYNIELTDGWYRIQAHIDSEMNMLLHKGIVKVGTKLIICNGELLGAGEGIDPLDVHDGIKLKISTNSTRRVRWYTKLGFYKYAALPIPITLDSVLPRGGIIGSLSFVILRKYSMMYLERKANSKSILRNEKMEMIEAEKYKAYQQKTLEMISNKVETELIAEMASTTKNSKNCIFNIKKESLDKLSIDELSNVLDNSTDPLEVQSLLSQETLEELKNFKKTEQEKFYHELQTRVNKVFNDQFKDTRKVTPLLKLRIVDEKNASTGLKSAILTIWNPSEDVSSVLNTCSEGQCCTCHNLSTNGIINGELHLSANKNTRFFFKGFQNEYLKRYVVSFKSLRSGTFFPLFGELDFVGIIVSDVIKNSNSSYQIFVSDKEMNIINILFQSDIKDYGCDDLMCPGNLISGVNIQFRGFDKKLSIPNLYTTEYTSFTSIPRSEYLVNIFNDYKMFMNKLENQDFLSSCQSKLREIRHINMEKIIVNNENPNQQCSSSSKNKLHKSYGELPVTVLKTSITSQSEFSPAQKRIKMLKSYGKTPPLNIVHSKPPDKKLLSQFKTPNRL